jgi:hypothetical protein
VEKMAKELACNSANNEILKDLKNEDVLAIDSIGILTEKDIRSALKAVKECEVDRDEAKEQNHIKELQRQRATRMYG